MEFYERVAALRREGRPFAVATVVARRPPVSAHLGDRAIVFADGRMEGFVGGACSREIIREQGLEAMAARAPRLVSIRPDAAEPAGSAERVVVPMTCASEGAVDVYVEPIVRPRTIVIAGATPVADAVARLAAAMRYAVVRVVEARERGDVEREAAAIGAAVDDVAALDEVLRRSMADDGDCGVVVASQGHYDEPALEVVLRHQVGYVGLVSSRKRGAMVRTYLVEAGVPGLDRLRNPAGLDLGGRTPEEVALSILAEVVRSGAGSRVEAAGTGVDAPPPPAPPATPARRGTMLRMARPAGSAVDPVCHMDVDIASAAHTAEVGGVTYYFCCGGCRARFLKDPHRYLEPAT